MCNGTLRLMFSCLTQPQTTPIDQLSYLSLGENERVENACQAHHHPKHHACCTRYGVHPVVLSIFHLEHQRPWHDVSQEYL
jgi:hypothetical protein